MARNQEALELAKDLWAKGHKKEARALLKMAKMNGETQELQTYFFEKVLGNLGIDLNSLELDPIRRIMSFDAEGFNFTTLGPFIERVLRSLNRVGNTSYELEKVRRGGTTVIEIKIGS